MCFSANASLAAFVFGTLFNIKVFLDADSYSNSNSNSNANNSINNESSNFSRWLWN